MMKMRRMMRSMTKTDLNSQQMNAEIFNLCKVIYTLMQNPLTQNEAIAEVKSFVEEYILSHNVKAPFNEEHMSDTQPTDFDLKTARESLDDATEPYSSGLTMLQIELIAEHFKIPVKKIEKLLEK